MKFLKKTQINFRNVKDNSIAVQVDGEITLDSTNAVLLPKGPTILTGKNGQMRYNTDQNQFEFFQNSQWNTIAINEPKSITQQSFVGNGTATYSVAPETPASSQSILVFVDNVFQAANFNYTVSGSTLTFDEPIPVDAQIIVLHGFNY
jgi:hypothetical protein